MVFPVVAAIAAALTLLGSESGWAQAMSDRSDDGGVRLAKVEAAAGKKTAKPAPTVSQAVDSAGMLAAQSRLAFNLIEALQKATPDAANLVVSPGSLAMVMTLIDLGADDRLKAALARTLAFMPAAASDKQAKGGKAKPAPAADLATVRKLVETLQSDQDAAAVLALANAIYVDPAAKTNPTTLAAISGAGGEVFEETLSTPEALAHINGWVRDKTRGLIPTILERTPSDPGLVALNALYFKDAWRTSFSPGRTRPASFTLADGSTAEVSMMAATLENVPTRADDAFVAAELAYKHDRFALVLVTSKDKPLRAAGFAPVASWLGGDGFAPATVDLSLPRLELSDTAQLLPVLDGLGLKEGRTSPTALDKFSKGQRISEVIQKTVLKVDEAGTEAAAATAVVTVRSAMRTQNQRISFDKPFVFALRDRTTGVVLLAGYVGDPKKAAVAATAETSDTPKPAPPPAGGGQDVTEKPARAPAAPSRTEPVTPEPSERLGAVDKTAPVVTPAPAEMSPPPAIEPARIEAVTPAPAEKPAPVEQAETPTPPPPAATPAPAPQAAAPAETSAPRSETPAAETAPPSADPAGSSERPRE